MCCCCLFFFSGYCLFLVLLQTFSDAMDGQMKEPFSCGIVNTPNQVILSKVCPHTESGAHLFVLPSPISTFTIFTQHTAAVTFFICSAIHFEIRILLSKVLLKQTGERWCDLSLLPNANKYRSTDGSVFHHFPLELETFSHCSSSKSCPFSPI